MNKKGEVSPRQPGFCKTLVAVESKRGYKSDLFTNF